MADEQLKTEFVKMGSRVTVLGADGDEEVYTIVGSAEANPRRGLISHDSPVGRALFGRKVGDSVTTVAPGGSFALRITAID